jgi:hypothetical protein
MIEATNASASYTYRVNEDDPRYLDRKENRHSARWKNQYFCYATAEQAKAELLRLGSKENKERL